MIEEPGGIYRLAISVPAPSPPAAAAPPADAAPPALTGGLVVQLHDVSDLSGVHDDLVDRVRALRVDDVRTHASTVLVVRATAGVHRGVAALLEGLRREQIVRREIEALQAELGRLGDEVNRLRAEVDRLKKNR